MERYVINKMNLCQAIIIIIISIIIIIGKWANDDFVDHN